MSIGFLQDVTFVLLAVGLLLILWLIWQIVRRRDTDIEERPCPNCGYDLRASLERCPECGRLAVPAGAKLDVRALRKDWPADPVTPRKPELGEENVCIWTTDVPWEADLLSQQLNARGIEATVEMKPRMVGRRYVDGPWHVLVWTGDKELADAYIERVRIKFLYPQDVEPADQS